MTMSTTGLLPSTPLHNTPFLNSLQFKLHLVPKLKNESTMAQFVSLSDIPHLKNPAFSRTQHAYDTANSSHEGAEHAIDECLTLLNQINKNSESASSSAACKQLHGRLVKVGALKADAFIGNKLVVAYSKSLESFNEARKLFEEISMRSIHAHAALISLYSRSEKWADLFSVFGMMVNAGMSPDRYLIPTILKACSVMRAEKIGKMVHGYAIRRGLGEDVFVGNALIDMYTKCGALRSSENVFDKMKAKDVVSWTSLIVAYMDRGFIDEAMEIFHRMELDGVVADLISWNALISGFALNGDIDMALRTLEEMQRKGVTPKVNTWNGIITGSIQNEFYEDALDVCFKMFRMSLTPNVVTIVSILIACAGLRDLKLGNAIYGYTIKLRLHGNAHVGGSLICMYWKCGRVDDAESIFLRIKHKSTVMCNEMLAAYMSVWSMEPALRLFTSMKDYGPAPDEITYNTMLASSFKDGRTEEAYKLLHEMSEMGVIPNVVTFNILISGAQRAGLTYESLRFFQAMQSPHNDSFLSRVLKTSVQPNPVTVTSALAACADLGSLPLGKELHACVVRRGLDSNVYVASALVDMYAKCSDIDSAIEVFWRTKNKNTVTWNTLLAGYINRRQEREALQLFERMLEEGVEPSPVTYMILIPACGEIGALRLGREMYGYLLKNQFDESDSNLESSVIDVSAKCGTISEANRVIDPKLQFKIKFKNDSLMKYIHYTSSVPMS